MARPNIWGFYNWVRNTFNSVKVSLFGIDVKRSLNTIFNNPEQTEKFMQYYQQQNIEAPSLNNKKGKQRFLQVAAVSEHLNKADTILTGDNDFVAQYISGQSTFEVFLSAFVTKDGGTAPEQESIKGLIGKVHQMLWNAGMGWLGSSLMVLNSNSRTKLPPQPPQPPQAGPLPNKTKLFPIVLQVDQAVTFPSTASEVSNEQAVRAIIGELNYVLLQSRLNWSKLESLKDGFYCMLKSVLNEKLATSDVRIEPTTIILRALHIYALMKVCKEFNIIFSQVILKLSQESPKEDYIVMYVDGSKRDIKEVINKVVDLAKGQQDKTITEQSVLKAINENLDKLHIDGAEIDLKLYLQKPERYDVNQPQLLPMNKFLNKCKCKCKYTEGEQGELLGILESPKMFETIYQKRCLCVLALYHVLQKENRNINAYPAYQALKVTDENFKADFKKKSKDYLGAAESRKGSAVFDEYVGKCVNFKRNDIMFEKKVKSEVFRVLETAGINFGERQK